MLGAKPHPPYDRPPLSKKLMMGELDSTSLDTDAAALGLDVRLGETATGLDGGVVRSRRGEYRFDGLIVATGATPVRLPGPGRQHVLRTVDDALDIRAGLQKGIRLAIVGAGRVGAELATAAVARGCAVTVLEAAAVPAAAALGEAAGSAMVPWYAAAGVDLRLGQPVESVQDGGLALPGGGWVEADLVVTAVGVRPCTGWLDGSGWTWATGSSSKLPSVLHARGLRRRGLRRVLVRPVRAAAAGGALGHGPALATRGGGQRARRRAGLRSGALFLVRAVRPDGPVRRPS